MLFEYLQGKSQMLFMLFLGLRVDGNVINEYYDERVKVFTEDSVMRSINAVGAFVRPNDITKNS